MQLLVMLDFPVQPQKYVLYQEITYVLMSLDVHQIMQLARPIPTPTVKHMFKMVGMYHNQLTMVLAVTHIQVDRVHPVNLAILDRGHQSVITKEEEVAAVVEKHLYQEVVVLLGMVQQLSQVHILV